MPNSREAQFAKLVKEFPDSPLGHFSLGKLYLEERRYEEAVQSLKEAVRLSPDYAAGYMALGSACAGAGRVDEARAAFEQARSVALQQKHPGLAEEAEERLADL